MEMLNRDVQETKQVSMAGITTCLMTNPVIQDWIVDSGANHHIIANKQLLTRRHELTKSQMNQVHLPTGDKVTVSHIGETPIFDNEVARSVLHVPDFKFNLLSVSKIARELNCFVSFYPDFCVFQDLYSGRVKGIGSEEEGLYSFKANFSSKQKEEIKCAQEIVVAGDVIQDTEIWHRRLGHPSQQILRYLKLDRSSKGDGVSTHCPVCHLAK